MSKSRFTTVLLTAPFVLVLAACASLLDVDFGAAHLDQDASVDGGKGCQAKTCQAQGFECGTQNDGCGEALECGTCKTGVCTSGKCACVPKTCPELKVQCGKVDDGCGNVLDCGGCANPADACNGQTNTCECKPKDCKAQGAECGSVPDGCGNTYTCGDCASNVKGPYCTNGTCGQAPCVPKTCQQLGKNCGQVSDGCGKVLTCGNNGLCTAPQTCGGGGTANVCGCTAKTCPQLGKNCGSVADGCGGNLSCGNCVAPQSCGGGGTANVCGCTPSGVCPLNANCGTVADGCGGNVSCGPSCALPNTCGGGGKPNVCGCTPLTCADYNCGVGVSNGCGSTLNCGSCGGGGCFVADTLVLLADGSSRPIASIHAGDVILGFDEASGVALPRTVSRLVIHPAEDSARGIILINGNLRSTVNHPFFVGGRAVRAEELKVGDVLETATIDGGKVTLHDEPISSIGVMPGGIVSYDLKTAPSGGYFVGPKHDLVLAKVLP